MADKLIVIHKNESRVSTFLIAKGFNRKHEHVRRLVKRYREDFEFMGSLVVAVEKRGRGQKSEEFLLNEEQFIFLGTLFKNSKEVVRFKRTLAVEFVRTNKLLLSVQSRQSSQEWVMSRDFGKSARLKETATIKDFVEYAESQGSRNADRYYTIITRMTNSLLFIADGEFKSFRNVLSPAQLMALATVEQIIRKGLRDGMKANTFYKDETA
jgi:phage regulator Rha-like protein